MRRLHQPAPSPLSSARSSHHVAGVESALLRAEGRSDPDYSSSTSPDSCAPWSRGCGAPAARPPAEARQAARAPLARAPSASLRPPTSTGSRLHQLRQQPLWGLSRRSPDTSRAPGTLHDGCPLSTPGLLARYSWRWHVLYVMRSQTAS